MRIYAPGIYPRKRQGSNRGTHDQYIRDHASIHAKNVAQDLKVSERFVVSRQRKLGLRPFTGNKRKGESHERESP